MMTIDQVKVGSSYRSNSGKSHRVQDIAGQQVLFEELNAHGFQVEGARLQHTTVAKFAAEHSPRT